jgi:hypothetical protein
MSFSRAETIEMELRVTSDESLAASAGVPVKSDSDRGSKTLTTESTDSTWH